jgi:hypothetical protein
VFARALGDANRLGERLGLFARVELAQAVEPDGVDERDDVEVAVPEDTSITRAAQS